jgi:hypothetical protein
MTTNISTPVWKEFYSEIQLMALSLIFREYGAQAILYQCECCDKWSAHHPLDTHIMFPISEPTKEAASGWCTANGFTVVGERVKDKIMFYN